MRGKSPLSPPDYGIGVGTLSRELTFLRPDSLAGRTYFLTQMDVVEKQP
jgi:hypothetical protein